MEKPEDFIFPARPFDAKRGLKNIEDIIIQIPTGRKTKDNQEETIPCLFKKTPNSNKLLIFFHCNGGDMFNAYYLLTKILENFNFNLLFPEYPGYTIYNSPKSSQKCFDDALIIYDFCLKNMKNLTEKNIYIFGRSLGTGPSIYVSSQRNPAGTFLLSPYTTFAEVARWNHKEEFYNELTKHLRSIDYIGNIKCPVCFFHGNNDHLINFKESEILFNKCDKTEKKELHFIDNMGHNDVIFYRNEMKELAQKFIEKYCPFEPNQDNISLDLDKGFYYKYETKSDELNKSSDDDDEDIL